MHRDTLHGNREILRLALAVPGSAWGTLRGYAHDARTWEVGQPHSIGEALEQRFWCAGAGGVSGEKGAGQGESGRAPQGLDTAAGNPATGARLGTAGVCACASDPRQEPGAGKPYAGICAGALGNRRPYRDHHSELNMPVESRSTKCDQCGIPLREDQSTPVEQRTGCPSYGSTARAFSVTISSTMEVHSQLRLKGRHASGGKPFIEQTGGSDLHQKTGILMRLERVIDRARDWYRERVIDPRTGEVVHECEEPLSEHKGHGTAKRRPTE
jgi:hypothetical protein